MGEKKDKSQSVNLTPNHGKVENHPELHEFRRHATYPWKDLNKDHNFALNVTSIGGLHKTLWASEVAGVLILGIVRLSIWKSWEKYHLDVTFMACHKKYYKKEGGGFPQVRAIMSLMNLCACGSSMHQKCSNYALTNLLFGL